MKHEVHLDKELLDILRRSADISGMTLEDAIDTGLRVYLAFCTLENQGQHVGTINPDGSFRQLMKLQKPKAMA